MKLEIRELYQAYQEQKNRIEVISNLSIKVNEGEFVSLIGPSGCGKSTLFNLIAGLERPDSGQILIDQEEISGQRGHVSYMMQKDLLFPWKTVLENILLGASLAPKDQAARKQAKAEAERLLPLFGLEEFAHHYPHVLSGGMKQRAALLRTFLHNKELMLLDEPFGALDALTREKMQDWLLSVWSTLQRTVLFITHSMDEALYLSDRIYVLGPRPTTAILELEVPLPRPRVKEDRLSPDFLSLKEKLMTALQ